jgi:hypothetical protein
MFLNKGHLFFSGLLLFPLRNIAREVFSFTAIYQDSLKKKTNAYFMIRTDFLYLLTILMNFCLQYGLFHISTIAWEVGNLIPLLASIFSYTFEFLTKKIEGNKWKKTVKQKKSMIKKKHLWYLIFSCLIVCIFTIVKTIGDNQLILPVIYSSFAGVSLYLYKMLDTDEKFESSENELIKLIEDYDIENSIKENFSYLTFINIVGVLLSIGIKSLLNYFILIFFSYLILSLAKTFILLFIANLKFFYLNYKSFYHEYTERIYNLIQRIEKLKDKNDFDKLKIVYLSTNFLQISNSFYLKFRFLGRFTLNSFKRDTALFKLIKDSIKSLFFLFGFILIAYTYL